MSIALPWSQRSTAAGVTLADDFTGDIQPHLFANAPSREAMLEIVKRVKKHTDGGLPCLKIEIIAPIEGGDTQGQAYRRRLNPAWITDQDGFGTTEFWVQFGFKIPASRLIPFKLNRGSWKFAIIANMSLTNPFGAPDQSSNRISLVLTNRPHKGVNFPTAYHHNDSYLNGAFVQPLLPGGIPGSDLNLQPGWDQGPEFTDIHERYCSYRDPKGCPDWPVDKWIYFQHRVRILSFGGTAGNERDVWWAQEGDTEWTQLYSIRDFLAGSIINNWKGGHNAIWLTMFETDRVEPGGVDTYALYRQLLVSAQEPAFPAELNSTVPIPDPEDPVPEERPDDLNLVISNIDFELVESSTANPMIVADVPDGPRTFEFRRKEGIPDPDPECILKSETEFGSCMPDGFRYKTQIWQCGELEEERSVKEACVYTPPPPSDEPATIVDGKLVVEKDAAGNVLDRCFNLPLNEYVEVPGTAMFAEVTKLLQQIPGFIDYGAEKLEGLFTDWAGGAHDDRYSYFRGGGHAGSSNNGIPKFDRKRFEWSWLMSPSVITPEQMAASKASWNAAPTTGVQPGYAGPWLGYNQGYEAGKDYWQDGKPTASHTYSTMQCHEGYLYLGRQQTNLWRVSLTTGIPEVLTPGAIPSDSSSAVDPDTDRIFYFRAFNIYNYSHASIYNINSNSLIKDKSIGIYTPYLSPVQKGRKLYMLQDFVYLYPNPTLVSFDLDTEAKVNIPLVNHPPRVQINASSWKTHSYPSTAFLDSTKSKIYSLHRSHTGLGKYGDYTVVIPETGECSVLSPTGNLVVPATAQNAPYNKMQSFNINGKEIIFFWHMPHQNLRLLRVS